MWFKNIARRVVSANLIRQRFEGRDHATFPSEQGAVDVKCLNLEVRQVDILSLFDVASFTG